MRQLSSLGPIALAAIVFVGCARSHVRSPDVVSDEDASTVVSDEDASTVVSDEDASTVVSDEDASTVGRVDDAGSRFDAGSSDVSRPDASDVGARDAARTAACDDGRRGEDETDIDCGGSCPLCGDGRTCATHADCVGGQCSLPGVCVSCGDGVLNQDETDVDCGGVCGGSCPPGAGCGADDDCVSGTCSSGRCVASCATGTTLVNGTNIVAWNRIGWSDRPPSGCIGHPYYALAGDLRFTASIDGVVEYEIRKRIPESVALVVTTPLCGGLGTELACELSGYTTSLRGSFPVTRGTSYALHIFARYSWPYSFSADPLTIRLTERAHACLDRVRNGDETDVDCGGTLCPACREGASCTSASDCDSTTCVGGTCAPDGCGDGAQNFTETDVDCGGASCVRCAIGRSCAQGIDCVSGSCMAGACRAPSCTDGVHNGTESDVDCGGGTCSACSDHHRCGADSDCASGACTDGLCGAVECVPFPAGATDGFGYRGCSMSLTPATLPCPDIAGRGTPLPMISDDASDVTVVPMGFAFDFYGATYTTAYVSSKGLVAFTPSLPHRSGSCAVPYAPAYDGDVTELIAAMWEDNWSSTEYAVLGAPPNRQFVVRWETSYYGHGPYAFELVLNEGTNDIEVCYIDTLPELPPYPSDGEHAVAGISHGAGTATVPAAALMFSCRMPNLTSGLMLRYEHP